MNTKILLKLLSLRCIFAILLTIFFAGGSSAERYTPLKSMPRIVGGIKATAGAWPWVVYLVNGPDNYWDGFCGGTLIDSKWVLTAAHCSNAPPFEVLIGVDNLNETGERITIINAYLHPEYFNSNGMIVPDIALLELERDATQTPIQLYDGSSMLEGVAATIIGWGSTNPDGSGYPIDLMQAQVPIVSQQTCINAYDNLGTSITDWELCAGYSDGGIDACWGDSGGPLMIYESGAWKIAGITSWGEGCAQPSYYGVYTRVSELYDWINQTMNPITGDYNSNGSLGLEDSIGILRELTGVE